MIYPFYVDVEWKPHDPDKWTPLVPVRTVSLAFPGNNGVCENTFNVEQNPEDWTNVGTWIREFVSSRPALPVGFDLRSKIWPSLIANLVARNLSLPPKLVMLSGRWNNVDMTDVKTLFLQGAYLPEQTLKDLSLKRVYQFICPDDDAAVSRCIMIHKILGKYMEAAKV